MGKNIHNLRIKVQFAALILLLIAGVFLLNMVMAELDTRGQLSIDLTANEVFKVGEETLSLLRSLDQDIGIYVLATEKSFENSSYFMQARHIINQYPQFSPRITLQYVDTVSDPTFAAAYPDLTLEQGSVLIVGGQRTKQIKLSELFNYTLSEAGELNVISSRAEEAITAAIVNVTSERIVRVAALTGNAVADMPVFLSLLTDNNYEVASASLATDALEGYDVALLLAPQQDLSEDMLRKLDEFLYNGGQYGKTLLYTADVSQKPLPNIQAFLREWGVEVGDGAVFERSEARTYQHQPFFPVADYADEGFKNKLKDANTPMLMPLSRPLKVLFASKDNNACQTLLAFGATSAVRPSDAGEDFTAAQATLSGPLPALVLAYKTIRDSNGMTQYRSNVLVSASNAMLEAYSIQNTSLANNEYLLNVLSALSERTDIINIQPKSLAGDKLSITTAQANTLGLMLAGILPLLILLGGVAVFLVRRYK